MSRVDDRSILAPRVRAAVLTVCAASVLATSVALLYGDRLSVRGNPGNDSYDRGPIGHRAFLETLQEMGVHTRRGREGYLESVEQPVIFIEPSPTATGTSSPVLDEVLRQRGEKGFTSILVLPKWRYEEDSERDVVLPLEETEVRAVLDSAFFDAALARAGEPTDPAAIFGLEGELGAFTLEIPWLQTISAPLGTRALLGTDEGALVVFSEAQRLMVISEPGIFHNVSLHRADHARLWWRILEHAEAGESLIVDEVFHGHGLRRSLGAALGGFPAVLIVVQGLFLGLVAVATGTKRFGAPLLPPPPFERGPKDVVRLTAQVMTVGYSPGLLAESYVEQILDELTLRLGLDDGGSIMERAANIDQVLERQGRSKIAGDLLARVQTFASRSSDDAAASLKIARQAWLLRRTLLESAGSRAPISGYGRARQRDSAKLQRPRNDDSR